MVDRQFRIHTRVEEDTYHATAASVDGVALGGFQSVAQRVFGRDDLWFETAPIYGHTEDFDWMKEW